ncbi:TonB-dependent receptor, partial [Bacteroidales bacterium OttesenSCG-928-M11]|nr:TonB-dependent receptor [Bacteroidales bacterium OttesenSCG-928-M11]
MLFLKHGLAIAQNVQVKGTVVDEYGEPIIGASVEAKGHASLGAITNVEGTFLLDLPQSVQALFVSYVGKERQEVAVAPNVFVVLKTADQLMDEVVVVGYVTQKRSSLTGSLSSIGSAKIEKLPVASLDEALKGNIAGLSASTGTGQPGADTKVIIRGVGSINAGTDPLYVVDGVPITIGNMSAATASGSYNGSTYGAMANLNPNDIESVTVLKDAAATAIYGSRAANGVIVITTKQGKEGKTQFNLSAQLGVSNRANTDLKMLNRNQYMELMTEAYLNSGWTQQRISEEFAKYPKDANGNFYDTNWLDEAYRSDAITQSYELSATGGTDKTNYFLSISHYSQEAILKWGDMTRTSARLNLNHKANNWLTFGVNSTYSLSEQDTPLTTAAYYVNPIAGSLTLNPLNPVYNQDGTYNHSPIGNNSTNFVEANDYNTNLLTTHRLIASMYGEISFMKNLKFKTLYGYDMMLVQDEQYDDPRATGSSADNVGRASRYDRTIQVWNWTNTLNYFETFNDDHNLNVLVGQEASARNLYFMGVETEGFASYKLRQPAAASEATNWYGYPANSRLVSLFGQVSYDYMSKYFLSGSFRYDGSSKFGLNNRFAPFWSVGGAWNVSEEYFLSDIEWLNQLKLRSSYGTTGNSDIGNYESYGLYSFDSYNGQSASYPSQIANPDLTWEKTHAFNVGLDFRFLKNRLGGTIEFYNKKTTDLLLNVPLSRTTGFTSQLRNIGDMQNRGLEVSLNFDVISTKDFTWRLDANWSANKNKVLSLSQEDEEISWGSSGRKLIQVGKDMFQYKLVKYAGVNPADGSQMWYDKDGELVFTRSYAEQATTGIGSATPKGQGGLTNTFFYKDFDLSLFFYFQYGNKIFDNVAYQYQHDGNNTTRNEITDMMDRW